MKHDGSKIIVVVSVELVSDERSEHVRNHCRTFCQPLVRGPSVSQVMACDGQSILRSLKLRQWIIHLARQGLNQ